MGMSANQARLMTLTARQHDLELRAQQISAQKMIKSLDSQNIALRYSQKLNEYSLQKAQGDRFEASPVTQAWLTSKGYGVYTVAEPRVQAPTSTDYTSLLSAGTHAVYKTTTTSTKVKLTNEQIIALEPRAAQFLNYDTPSIAHLNSLEAIYRDNNRGMEGQTALLYYAYIDCIDDSYVNEGYASRTVLRNTFATELTRHFGAGNPGQVFGVRSLDEMIQITPDGKVYSPIFSTDERTKVDYKELVVRYIEKTYSDCNFTLNDVIGNQPIVTTEYTLITERPAFNNNGDLTYNADGTVNIEAVKAEYESAMASISTEEKLLDMELTQINTEHNAVKTEYDSVKGLVSENTDKSFNVFS